MDSEDFIGFCQSCKKEENNVPIAHIIEKLDRLYSADELERASKLLDYWLSEADRLQDERGKLTVLSEVMGLSRRLGDKKRGIEAVNEGFGIIEKLNISELVSSAIVYINGATTLKAFGKANEARPYFEKAAAVLEKNLQKDDLRLAGLYNNYATCLCDLNEFSLSETYYKKALAVTEGKGLPEEAVTLVNLAQLCEKRGDGETVIESFMEKAYLILSDGKIKRDGNFAFVCEKCAPTFDYYGYFVYKQNLFAWAKEIYERN